MRAWRDVQQAGRQSPKPHFAQASKGHAINDLAVEHQLEGRMGADSGYLRADAEITRQEIDALEEFASARLKPSLTTDHRCVADSMGERDEHPTGEVSGFEVTVDECRAGLFICKLCETGIRVRG
jgi:hypothetical protein